MEKTTYSAKRMPKQKTISNSNSISILDISSTHSRPNGKCNICAFHEENHAFEDWILSGYQVLFLLLNGPQIETSLCLIDLFPSIYDIRRKLQIDFAQSVAQNRQNIF